MKAIVTGATGGLGRSLVESLLAHGWRVTAFGRNEKTGALLKTPFYAFDLSDEAAVLKHWHEADAVFHCAALSSPWGSREAFERANVTATAHVLKALKQHPAGRLVYVSTPSIYFDFRDRTGIAEDFLPERFVNGYAASKFRAERLVRDSGVPHAVLRPRGIFGAYDTALLPRLLRIARHGFLPLVRRPGREAGDALIDITYAENVVQAMLAAARPDRPTAGVYNISNLEPLTVRRIFTLLCDTLPLRVKLLPVPYAVLNRTAGALEILYRTAGGREPPLTRYSVGTLAFDHTLDCSAARQQLGYTPAYTVAQGLERYAASLTRTA